MEHWVALWLSSHCRGPLRPGSSSNPGLKHMKGTEINVVVKKSAQLEDYLLLRSLPGSAEPGPRHEPQPQQLFAINPWQRYPRSGK